MIFNSENRMYDQYTIFVNGLIIHFITLFKHKALITELSYGFINQMVSLTEPM